MKKLSLACILAIAAFGYFNENNYIEPNHTIEVDSYAYYAEGVHSASIYINKELKNGRKCDITLSQRQVLMELPNNDIANIIFFKEIGERALGINPTIIRNKINNKIYALFANDIDRTQAKKASDKLRAYQFKAQVVDFSKTSSEFEYYDWLDLYFHDTIKPLECSKNVFSFFGLNKDKTKNHKNRIEIKASSKIKTQSRPQSDNITDEKILDLNEQPNKNFVAVTKDPLIKVNLKEIFQEISSGDDNNKTTEAPKIIDKQTKKCLDFSIDLLKKHGLFNPETLEFKINNTIYKKNTLFSHKKCSLKVTDIESQENIFMITFNYYTDNKVIIKLQNAKNNFIPMEQLLYSPYQSKYSKLSGKMPPVKIAPKAIDTNSDTANKSVVKQSQPYQESINQMQTYQSYQEPTSQTQTTSQNSSSIDRASSPNLAKCSFNTQTGIRTQLSRQADGSFKAVAVYDFYKGKENVEVDYYQEGENYAITSQGGQTMIISPRYFKKGCKFE